MAFVKSYYRHRMQSVNHSTVEAFAPRYRQRSEFSLKSYMLANTAIRPRDIGTTRSARDSPDLITTI